MKKIPSLFKRDYAGTRQVYDEVVEGCEWVQAGEGIPTEKIDGTCCLIQDGKLFKRYDAKKGRIPPTGFIPTGEPDEVTGHCPGWLPVGFGPEDQWHREAFNELAKISPDHIDVGGTFELIGPKVQGNPYRLDQHILAVHGENWLDPDELGFPTDFQKVRAWLEARPLVEGIVWEHRSKVGVFAKIKRKDFGFPWPPKETP